MGKITYKIEAKPDPLPPLGRLTRYFANWEHLGTTRKRARWGVLKGEAIALLAMAFFLAGCSPSVVIRDAKTNAPGEIKSLKSELKDATDGMLLVFVHGVGDHCPGYALNESDGWLNQDAQKELSLHEVADSYKEVPLQDPAHWNNSPDPASTYTVAKREFDYSLGGKTSRLRAVELTWSGLTRWVKTKQLGYDLTEPVAKTPCTNEIPKEFDQPRVLMNRILKEQTLDRLLSDAVLYVGSYGTKINFAMADSLCRALTDDFDSSNCDWAAAQTESAKARTVIFVTHSLGSRIVYDTLLEMTGQQQARAVIAFDHGSTTAQRGAVASNVLQRNAATFMMANQLPLLGLTYVPPQYRSEDKDTPYLRNFRLDVPFAFAFPAGPTGVPLNAPPQEVLPQLTCGANPVACAALVRTTDQPPMEVVAFSDTNDLLTYAVSKPYATDSTGTSETSARFHFTNAYVHNSPRVLWLFENPGPAHTQYFFNPSVRRVIICGGKNREITSCKLGDQP